MPTDQKLDPEAEARIREACVNLRGGSDSDRSGDEWHNPEPYDFDAPNATCLCRDLRAAILADREARPFRVERRPQCAKHGCDLTSTITESWYCAVCEAAHADALAEMIRVLRDELDAYRSRTRECPCCDAPVQPHEDGDTAHLPDCAWVRSDDLLAAHYRTRS